MRTKLIVGNWKMNGSHFLIDRVNDAISSKVDKNSLEIVICPPDVLIYYANNLFQKSGIFVGSQNVHSEPNGAFTGETSALLLRECGINWCIVGHSERREIFGETDDLICKKIEILIEHNIRPILCVGETKDQRESLKYEEVVVNQLRKCFSKLNSTLLNRCVVAYEPVWAIGTGKTADPEQVNVMHKIIRNELASLSNRKNSEKMQIIYGGSVNPENIKELMSMEEIDGALVGGASIVPDKFKEIVDLLN